MAKQVVIIGGGLSSKHCAETLLKKSKSSSLEVTIVQANRFVEWPLAMTVCLVRPDLHDKALAANPDKFQIPGVKYKYGVVESVDTVAREIQLAGADDKVLYDCLIVATGFSLPLVYPKTGMTVEERKAEVQSVGDAINKGSHIVVAGGGPVGLELVGDIRGQYPDKKVSLLVRDDVLGQWPEPQRARVRARLQKMDVELVPGWDSAIAAPTDWSLQPGTITAGEVNVAYDVFLPAYSRGPNTKFLAGSLLDTKGRIQVNDHLQSKTCKEIFAVGVSNFKEPFIAIPKLEGQWNSVAANVMAMFAGKPLKNHAEGATFMKLPPVVTIGHGPTGYAYIDCNNVPAVLRCCCCKGLGGFPCCPPCWPCCACAGCGACPCGYCCGPPEGKGPSILAGKLAFLSFGFHFKGVGDVPSQAPAQQTMGTA